MRENSNRGNGQNKVNKRNNSRRSFLTATVGAGVAATAGCLGKMSVGNSGGNSDSKSGDKMQGGKNVVNILTWEGYGTKDIVNQFEKEHDAKVNIKLVSSDAEAFNILKSGGVDKFDLLTLNNTWAQRHAQAGTIEPLKPDDYKNMSEFLEQYQWPFNSFKHDNEMYALPTRWGWDTLTVNTKKVPKEDYSSYEVLWTGGPNGKYKNKIGIMDWPTWNIPKVALTLGYPPFKQNEKQLKDIKKKLVEMFSNMKAVYSGTSAIRQAILQEDIVMAPVGNFAMSQLRADGNKWVDVVIPKQGGMQWTEGLCIVKNPNNRKLAVEFQNKIISNEGQFNVAWKPSAKSPPVNTASFGKFDEKQQEVLMFDKEGFKAADKISEKTTPYEFSPITDKWTDLWTEAKARAGV
ncbi:ABC transporter substrate-binding protein [Haladaptatus sp. DFWS20]|uniref:ABC transporter substrate-binding protein n=1 Tax=Haladaptatus sp. DFWS20 TaxID=3403467 RepID=UPI003EBEAAAB